jgi:deoxyribodipyrimidine photo-lyase
VSYLSVHLRFGTVSVRHLARTARQEHTAGAETWLSELIWREFYVQLLHHHPQLAAGLAYKAEFEQLAFSNDPGLFAAWCEGRTGYPSMTARRRLTEDHSIEKVGSQLRSMMPWISKNKLVDKTRN